MTTPVHMKLQSPDGEIFEVFFPRAKDCVIAYGWKVIEDKPKPRDDKASVQPPD